MLDSLTLGILSVFYLIPALIFYGLSILVHDPDRQMRYELNSIRFWMAFDKPEEFIPPEQLEAALWGIKIFIIVLPVLIVSSILKILLRF
jgi:hypothetical protein